MRSTTSEGPIVLLMGPTAAGKTDLALELIEELPLEIISVDSAMIYRGLDIGTGKPSREILSRIPHHLVDILDPSERYSAGQFIRDVTRLIADIRSRGKVPFLVGGTMMYFKSFMHGLAELPAADMNVRMTIDARGAALGWPALHAELEQIDPLSARKILPNDGQRIQRALEVYELTGKPLSELQAATIRYPLNDDALALSWCPSDRATLYDRIAKRFDTMMRMGFLDEVRYLYGRRDLVAELPSLRSVGYRQLWGHLAGEYDKDEAIRLGVIATRQLARRQLIWLRAMREIESFDSLEVASVALIKSKIETHLATKL